MKERADVTHYGLDGMGWGGGGMVRRRERVERTTGLDGMGWGGGGMVRRRERVERTTALDGRG